MQDTGGANEEKTMRLVLDMSGLINWNDLCFSSRALEINKNKTHTDETNK